MLKSNISSQMGKEVSALENILQSERRMLLTAIAPAELEVDLETEASKGVAVICCSEMGMTSGGLSRNKGLPIYFCQNLGGCVSDAVTIEMLAEKEEVNDMVVLGHYGCLIVEYGLRCDDDLESEKDRSYRQIVQKTQKTRKAMTALFGSRFDKQIMRIAIEDFVLREVNNLLDRASILTAVKRKRIRLHAWIMNSENEIATFDPSNNSFWVRQ